MTNLMKDVVLKPDVKQMIAERAYYISEASGFAPGREFDFWIQAETEMLSYLAQSPTTTESANGIALKKAVAPKAAKVAIETVVPSVEKKPTTPRKRTTKKASE